ncbi:MAG: TPM domain-containing protein [Lentimicrobiaceae bacterium]|nr:TPM domain-containing protein [Lentimicrobiaceae bacterium]
MLSKLVHKLCLWGLMAGFLLSALSLRAAHREVIPPAPVPPRLVNDYAGILKQEAVWGLERLLRAFNDSTSNQITIVTLTDLGNYSASEAAYEIGESWGVGSSKYNNGVVILIKPKNENGSGEVFIAPGYGLEAALPDAVCKRIIEDEMIPYFRQNDYALGIIAGLRVIMPLASGEISAKEYMPKEAVIVALVAVLVMIVGSVLLIRTSRRDKNNGNGGGNGNGNDEGNGKKEKVEVDPGLRSAVLGTLWGLGNAAGRSYGGGYGGGGGFGGFGGGSFGGGGAGGRW